MDNDNREQENLLSEDEKATCKEPETCVVNIGHLCETGGDRDRETIEMRPLTVERLSPDAGVPICVQGGLLCVRMRSLDTAMLILVRGGPVCAKARVTPDEMARNILLRMRRMIVSE